MDLSPKYTVAIVLSVFAIFAWNGFLIVRDAKMFEAYDKTCAQLPKSHPDCVLSK